MTEPTPHERAPVPDDPEFDIDLCTCGEEWPCPVTEPTRNDFLALARRELDMLDGTLVPEFVMVEDGRYTGRIVLDEMPVASCDLTLRELKHHTEPFDAPKFRPELRWRPA